MGRAFLADRMEGLLARLDRWRRRRIHAEACELKATYGEDAVRILRERIAACSRFDERRRLYQLHDEVARGLS